MGRSRRTSAGRTIGPTPQKLASVRQHLALQSRPEALFSAATLPQVAALARRAVRTYPPADNRNHLDELDAPVALPNRRDLWPPSPLRAAGSPTPSPVSSDGAERRAWLFDGLAAPHRSRLLRPPRRPCAVIGIISTTERRQRAAASASSRATRRARAPWRWTVMSSSITPKMRSIVIDRTRRYARR